MREGIDELVQEVKAGRAVCFYSAISDDRSIPDKIGKCTLAAVWCLSRVQNGGSLRLPVEILCFHWRCDLR